MPNQLLVVSSNEDGNGKSGVLEDLVPVRETKLVYNDLVVVEGSSGTWNRGGSGVCS